MSYINHRRTFLEMYRQQSFPKAAQISITQPAVSQQIQSLESFIGKPLFVRLARGVAATEVADNLANSVAASLDTLEQKLSGFRFGAVSGEVVHLAAPADFVHYQMVKVLQGLLSDGFSVRLQMGNRSKLYQLLESRQIDFAITASKPDEQHYAYETVFAEKPLLVYAPALTHKIGKTPNKERLSQLPFISFDEELSGLTPLWQTLFREPPPFQAALTVPDLRIVKQMVVEGMGWSVLSDYHCTQEIQAGRLLVLNNADDTAPSPLYLVWHKHRVLPRNMQYVKQRLLEGLV
ncbi:LysR family transcriptional regulator [Neisseria sicca]|nr:LysR family transcriptional regulator [Neisseria sicca]